MQKAKVLYDAISGSNGFYNSPVDPGGLCTGCCAARLAMAVAVAVAAALS